MTRPIVSKEKLKIAQKRFDEYLTFLVPVDCKPKDWVKEIAKTGDIPGDIFEHVYRAYHRSFKVVYMQSVAENFVNMITYLFADKIKVDYFDASKYKNHLGFPRVVETLAGKDTSLPEGLDMVFREDSYTYRLLADVLKREAINPKGYWKEYEPHHLTFMGGVFFCLVCSISLLGMLQRYNKKGYKVPAFISYSDGVATYVLGDVNFECLRGRKNA